MSRRPPPIPAGAIVRARELGAGLALLGYCYDRVGRDGQLALNLHTVAEACGVSVMTARRWWAAMQERGIVVDVRIRGRAGVSGRMHADWLDWRGDAAPAQAPLPEVAAPTQAPLPEVAAPLEETPTAADAAEEPPPATSATSGALVIWWTEG
ncbi:hypothetical protein F8S13_22155 [Chloroflexia bacterium SDU3-3]|nr:hypothetical protein F8S13_22155 [Chloroflexia bacterium SDU3-3]